MTYKVVAFYKFFPISNAEIIQLGLKAFCHEHNLCGIILVAPEGINGTIAGSSVDIDKFVTLLLDNFGFDKDDYKFSSAKEKPFKKMKVKLKKEIVTFKQDYADPNKQVGTYISPKDWNDLISNPDITVIDTRNDFEVQMGTFENAVDPMTESFSEFADYVEGLDPKKHKKIAMFCTGGIRCEKASSYMIAKGFEEVYHLKGGILKYLEEVPQEQSKWMGSCFVFDDRVAITHGLKELSE